MKTLGKFSLFIVFVLVLGCGKKKAGDRAETAGWDPSTGRGPDRVEAKEKEPEEEGSLESRCFGGDVEACDELGH
ncbi:MAG: hypothetical protein OEM15_04820 [Myxococcales bacterium]|nr:hypothetical protein [Myxococcales bacterium]MDH3484156.1 hypothetical protein [Myxococcales bacterium]